jgi:hypothetical protein
MGSFDHKEERAGRFCDRADENSEIPSLLPAQGVGVQARTADVE